MKLRRSTYWVKYDASAGQRKRLDGDCTVRALATARGCTYQDAWRVLYALQGETKTCDFRLAAWLRSHSDRLGVVRQLVFPARRGTPRMTGDAFCAQHRTGRFILRMAHHVAAVKDGQLFDVWNSSSRCVYAAWEVEAVACEQVA